MRRLEDTAHAAPHLRPLRNDLRPLYRALFWCQRADPISGRCVASGAPGSRSSPCANELTASPVTAADDAASLLCQRADPVSGHFGRRCRGRRCRSGSVNELTPSPAAATAGSGRVGVQGCGANGLTPSPVTATPIRSLRRCPLPSIGITSWCQRADPVSPNLQPLRLYPGSAVIRIGRCQRADPISSRCDMDRTVNRR